MNILTITRAAVCLVQATKDVDQKAKGSASSFAAKRLELNDHCGGSAQFKRKLHLEMSDHVLNDGGS